VLVDAGTLLGGRQIQASATVGGNVCHASPAAEMATPLVVLDAIAVVEGGAGRRELPVADLWAGPRRTVLAHDEVLVALRLPDDYYRQLQAEYLERRDLLLGHAAVTAGEILAGMVLGSLVIGLIADTKQADGIKPFTTDIFKGFLAIFLLEMGMVTARRFAAFLRYGRFVTLFAVLVPVLNGCLVATASHLVTESVGNRFIFAILGASASYIAVPAAMRLAAPKADPGLYIPMALGVTFPVNITVGMPLYFAIVQHS